MQTKTLYMAFKRAKNQANEQRKGWRFECLVPEEDIKSFENCENNYFVWTVRKVVVDLPE